MDTSKYLKSALLCCSIGCVLVLAAHDTYKQPISEKVEGREHSEKRTLEDTIIKSSPGIDAFRKIIERYERPDYMLRGKMQLYSVDSKYAPEAVSFTSISSGANSLYEIDSVQTILCDNMALLVDKRERKMIFLNKNTVPGRMARADVGAELKKISRLIKSVEIIPDVNERKLSVTFSEGMPGNITAYEIWYNPSSFQVSRIKMEMETTEFVTPDSQDITDSTAGPIEEIVYLDSNNVEVSTGAYGRTIKRVYEIICLEEKNVTKDVLKLSNYLIKEEGRYVLAGDHKNYEILN